MDVHTTQNTHHLVILDIFAYRVLLSIHLFICWENHMDLKVLRFLNIHYYMISDHDIKSEKKCIIQILARYNKVEIFFSKTHL